MTKMYMYTGLKVRLSLILLPGLITPVATWGPCCELHGVWMTVSLLSRITCSQTISLRRHQGTALPSRLRTVDLPLVFFALYVQQLSRGRERSNQFCAN